MHMQARRFLEANQNAIDKKVRCLFILLTLILKSLLEAQLDSFASILHCQKRSIQNQLLKP